MNKKTLALAVVVAGKLEVKELNTDTITLSEYRATKANDYILLDRTKVSDGNYKNLPNSTRGIEATGSEDGSVTITTGYTRGKYWNVAQAWININGVTAVGKCSACGLDTKAAAIADALADLGIGIGGADWGYFKNLSYAIGNGTNYAETVALLVSRTAARF